MDGRETVFECRELRQYAAALDNDRGHSKSRVTALMREAADTIELLWEAINLVDDPYPLQVFPDLQEQDAVFAAMREVNKYATEQFFAETARQRGKTVREYVEKHRRGE